MSQAAENIAFNPALYDESTKNAAGNAAAIEFIKNNAEFIRQIGLDESDPSLQSGITAFVKLTKAVGDSQLALDERKGVVKELERLYIEKLQNPITQPEHRNVFFDPAHKPEIILGNDQDPSIKGIPENSSGSTDATDTNQAPEKPIDVSSAKKPLPKKSSSPALTSEELQKPFIAANDEQNTLNEQNVGGTSGAAAKIPLDPFELDSTPTKEKEEKEEDEKKVVLPNNGQAKAKKPKANQTAASPSSNATNVAGNSEAKPAATNHSKSHDNTPGNASGNLSEIIQNSTLSHNGMEQSPPQQEQRQQMAAGGGGGGGGGLSLAGLFSGIGKKSAPAGNASQANPKPSPISSLMHRIGAYSETRREAKEARESVLFFKTQIETAARSAADSMDKVRQTVKGVPEAKFEKVVASVPELKKEVESYRKNLKAMGEAMEGMADIHHISEAKECIKQFPKILENVQKKSQDINDPETKKIFEELGKKIMEMVNNIMKKIGLKKSP